MGSLYPGMPFLDTLAGNSSCLKHLKNVFQEIETGKSRRYVARRFILIVSNYGFDTFKAKELHRKVINFDKIKYYLIYQRSMVQWKLKIKQEFLVKSLSSKTVSVGLLNLREKYLKAAIPNSILQQYQLFKLQEVCQYTSSFYLQQE